MKGNTPGNYNGNTYLLSDLSKAFRNGFHSSFSIASAILDEDIVLPFYFTATAIIVIPILGNDGKGTTVRGIINIPRYYHTNREKAPLGARQLSDNCCGRYYPSIIFCIVTRNNYFSKN